MTPSMFRTYTIKLLAGSAAAALVIGAAAGVGAQTASPSLPPEQASPPASSTAANLPSIPLGHDDVRELQNQLIALGFDPGSADGQAGPATVSAAQQYDQSRGGSGRVSIDEAFLARLKNDTAPRLTYEQVAERSNARRQAQTSGSAAPAAASQFGSVVQQIAPILGAAISNSNRNNNGYYGQGPGYYGQGPGYYGPGPGYYGYRSGYGGY